MEPVFTMQGIVLVNAPCVVHVGCDRAGCATIVIDSVEKSPSGIWNDTEAPAFDVIVPGVLMVTSAEPTKPQPRPLLSAPLCCVPRVAVIPAGPVNLNPDALVRSIELPHTSNVMLPPAMTVSALPEPAM